MSSINANRVQKLIRFDESTIHRINKVKGLRQAETGHNYSEQDFYGELIEEGLKNFEHKYNFSFKSN